MILLTISACGTAERPLTAAELLDLGEKYLLELNYEQALVYFTRLIEVEPMNPRGYMGAAEAYVGLGQINAAVAVLREGLEALPSNSEIQNMLYELGFQDINTSNPSTGQNDLPDDVRIFLSELLIDYETGGYESVYAVAETEEYQSVIEKITEYPMIYVDYSRNYGIGLYSDANNIFIYIGGYSGSFRNGYGYWIMMTNLQEFQYRFEGEWARDLPNGQGTEYSISFVYDYEYTNTGMVVNGLWNGQVAYRLIPTNENFIIFFSNGKFVVLNDQEQHFGENPYIIGHAENDENHTFHVSSGQLNMLHGIFGCFENNNIQEYQREPQGYQIPNDTLDFLSSLYSAYDAGNKDLVFQMLSENTLPDWFNLLEPFLMLNYFKNENTTHSNIQEWENDYQPDNYHYFTYRINMDYHDNPQFPFMSIYYQEAQNGILSVEFGLPVNGSTYILTRMWTNQFHGFTWEEMTYQDGKATGDYKEWDYHDVERGGTLSGYHTLTKGHIIDGAFQGEVIYEIYRESYDAYDVMYAIYDDGLPQPLGVGERDGWHIFRKSIEAEGGSGYSYYESPVDDGLWSNRRPYDGLRLNR